MDTEQLIRDVVRNVLEKLKTEGSNFKIQSGNAGEQKKETQTIISQVTDHGTMAGSGNALRTDKKIVCGVSVRHIHLCREHLDVLFGKGYALNVLRELYNPGFASKETLTVVGPKLTAIQNVRILGPLRSKTQVELAKTDCIALGIDAPVRPSGEVTGTSSCVLVGPKGAVYLSEGAIRANRHLHMSSEDAEYFKIKDNQVVDIRVPGPKGLTFNNVQVRVAPDFKTEFHVDTDDGNAADIVNGTIVEIVDATCISPLVPQMANGDRIPPSIPDGSFIGEVTDPNLIRNICSIATGQTCTKEQITNAVEAVRAAAQSSTITQGPGSSAGTSLTKKTLITADDLDNYVQTGIRVSSGVILTPLARDEAAKRGIQVSYDQVQ